MTAMMRDAQSDSVNLPNGKLPLLAASNPLLKWTHSLLYGGAH